jgi:DNA-binding transcriptional MerR regulator
MLATISEASSQLGITRQTLDKWRKAGKVTSVQQDGRTFIALPDPEPAGDLRSILEGIADLPAARAAVADAEAVLAGMLDRLAECRRLLNPLRSNADNARVVNGGGFDGLAGEVDQLTISLAAQRAKVLRCRLRVAELIRDAVTPHVAPARSRYDSLRASLAEAGSVLQDLQSTAESARREASDLQYQLKSIHLA